MNLLWLEQTAAQQLALVGGKAANLSRLAASYRVPAGFCLTTAAFDRAHRGAGQLPASLPRSLYAELAAAYRRLAAQTGASAAWRWTMCAWPCWFSSLWRPMWRRCCSAPTR